MGQQSVYWIGGSACAGKSTLAKMYADKYGLALYACDDHFQEHMQQTSREIQPAMHRISRLTMNEVFYTREVDEQLNTYIKGFEEDFAFVLSDLARMGEKAVVVEGNQLLPALVAPLLKNSHRAIWIVPTEQFQWEHYSKREWIHDLLQETENPGAAFHNWMKRDALFAARVKEEAEARELMLLEVDGSLNLEQSFTLLEQHFGSWPGGEDDRAWIEAE